MSREQGSRIEEVFARALDLSRGERAAFLAEECGEDLELLAQVQSLLEAHEESATTAQPWPGMDPEALQALLRDEAPGLIDRYRLIERIGSGGMGVVYRAERCDGAFEQTVAVKLLHPGASEEALQRFSREREILATLEHPHIARLLDGGVTSQGQPYLVVEFVDGRPIDRYLRQQSPPLAERVRILAALCTAVQAAHQRLVVHRDIKPGNILVNAQGEAKLLDFGIAKLLVEAGGAELTRTAQNPMTVQYASPEQLLGQPVTVASDVYQLGLLAYEVLSGQRAYELAGCSSVEAIRQITQVQPPPPSARLAAGDRRALQGDLDTIVLKALHKDPQRRYGSAEELRSDLERWLEGRPIAARPSTFWYRSSRFVKRNALPFAVGAAAVALLAISSVAFTLQLIRERDRSRAAADLAELRQVAAEQARDEATELLDFIWTMFDNTSPRHTQGKPVSALELLAAGRREVEARRFERPRTRATLLSTLGTLYRRHGLLEEATTLQNEALALLGLDAIEATTSGREELAARLAGAGREAVDAAWEIARVHEAKANYQAARDWLRLCLDATEIEDGDSSTRVGLLRSNLASVLETLGDLGGAESEIDRAIAILEANLGTQHQSTAQARLRRGYLQNSLGNYPVARKTFEQAIADLEAVEPNSPLLTEATSALAMVHDRLGNLESALHLFERVEVLSRSDTPDGHPNRLVHTTNTAMMLRRLERFSEAESTLRKAIENNNTGQNLVVEANSHNALAAILAESGRAEEALPEYELGLEMMLSSLPEDHPNVAIQLNNRGEALAMLQRAAEAERDFHDAQRIFRGTLGDDHYFMSYPLLNLAKLKRDSGDLEEAEAFARRAFEIRNASQGLEGTDRSEALEVWISILERLGATTELDQARALRSGGASG